VTGPPDQFDAGKVIFQRQLADASVEHQEGNDDRKDDRKDAQFDLRRRYFGG
jgi:hypothetical protein